jgi:hypothetical protein
LGRWGYDDTRDSSDSSTGKKTEIDETEINESGNSRALAINLADSSRWVSHRGEQVQDNPIVRRDGRIDAKMVRRIRTSKAGRRRSERKRERKSGRSSRKGAKAGNVEGSKGEQHGKKLISSGTR